MIRSLLLAGTIAGAVAQPAFNTSVVSPVRTLFDGGYLYISPNTICNAITEIFDSGATEIYLDSMLDGVVQSDTVLEYWLYGMSNPTGKECMTRNAGKGKIGIMAMTSDQTSASPYLSVSAKLAKDNGFSFIQWIYKSGMDCSQANAQTNADDFAKTVADNVKAAAGVDLIVLITPNDFVTCPEILPSLNTAVTDKTYLKSIALSYFDQASTFTTYESIFVQSPSDFLPGVSITELNAAAPNLKGYFAVMKPIDSKSLKLNPTDFIPISTLKEWTCQAQRDATIGYNKGMELFSFHTDSNSDDMTNGGLLQDCDGGDLPSDPVQSSTTSTTTTTTTTSSTKASGAGTTTYAISAIAVIVTVVSLLN